MGRPYSQDLRERVVAAFRSGLVRAEVAARFRISRSSVQRWGRLDRHTGSVAAQPMGGKRPLARAEHRDWILARIARQPGLPRRAVLAELHQRGIGARYYALWNLVRQAGLSFKETGRGPASVPPAVVETGVPAWIVEGSGRWISGGDDPVKKRGPRAVARLRVVTPSR
jgi:transposase